MIEQLFSYVAIQLYLQKMSHDDYLVKNLYGYIDCATAAQCAHGIIHQLVSQLASYTNQLQLYVHIIILQSKAINTNQSVALIVPKVIIDTDL